MHDTTTRLHGDRVVGHYGDMTKRSRRHYTDRDGVLRHVGTGRKVRSDYGMAKPHPAGCLHCAVVAAWREQADIEHEAAGGWRNEDFRPSVGFFEFQANYYRELRLAAEHDESEALAWAA
jgi:hypothetical protein